MRSGTFYLNNNGSRWVNLTNGEKDKFLLITPEGDKRIRTVEFYSQFGNHGYINFKFRGERLSRFPEEEKINNLMVVKL